MAQWWKKRLPMWGSVLFRGQLPPQPSDFEFLSQQGISMKLVQGSGGAAWKLDLVHPQWGEAQLGYHQDLPLPPREMLQYSSTLTQEEKEMAISAQSMVGVQMKSRHEHVLRDRKLLLRYLRAVMRDDGLIAIDHLAQKEWSRHALDDELCHDADLDVEGIMSLHVVSDNSEKPFWAHSHGLGEIGGFDFDIFDPHEDVLGTPDIFRAMAFHILDGTVSQNTPGFVLMEPKGGARLVDMVTFLKNTDPRRRKDLEEYIDEEHTKKHSVLCEPGTSMVGRLLGRQSFEPVRFLSRKLPENPIFMFSNSASDLMAERARNTYPLLRSFHQEFAEFGFPCLSKLGLQVDGGGEKDREHLWFMIDGLQDDTMDLTLQNQPYYISALKLGDQGHYSTDQLSDWMILTPAGSITPRSIHVAHVIRSHRERLLEMMRKARSEGMT